MIDTERYLKEGGKRCPLCGSGLLDKKRIKEHPLFLHREVVCVEGNCGLVFTEEFVLVDVKGGRQ